MIEVCIKEPGKAPELRNIENKLQALQEIVGGYIETVTLSDDVVVICNEDGRLLGLAPNCRINDITFVGTIIIAGVNDDELADIKTAEGLDLEVIDA